MIKAGAIDDTFHTHCAASSVFAALFTCFDRNADVGDAYVAAVLEAIIADISIFPDTDSDRVALYKLFTKLFGSVTLQIPEPASPFAWEQRASVNLSKVSPLARQAFLLASVESFRLGEIADILDVSESDAMHLLDTASQEISRQWQRIS